MFARHHGLLCTFLVFLAAFGHVIVVSKNLGPQIAGKAKHHPPPLRQTTSLDLEPPMPTRPLLANAKKDDPVFTPLAEDFLKSILSADETQVALDLPGGGQMRGRVTAIQRDVDGLQRIEGEVTDPEAGRFMFQRQTVPGKAGSLVGFIHFDKSETAYQVRPQKPSGKPALFKTTAGAVICRAYPPRADPAEIPPTHPTDYPIPPEENGIIQLQSLPGASAVVYLDYDGEERHFDLWGYVNAQPFAATNTQIHDVWKGVSEDLQPFSINVTTVRSVYDAAPEARRMHVIVTPTSTTSPGSGGVAYVGSFNWSGEMVCWAFFGIGKDGIEVISHEIGHTLGLSHQGTSATEYYEGHSGWAPIMGRAFFRNPSQWSKGEYPGAKAYNDSENGFQDDLETIVTNNNDVAYRTDDHGSTYAAATWLEITTPGTVSNEGIIETAADEDSFRFSTGGGTLSLDIQTVAAYPNLDLKAEILDSSGTLKASHDPANSKHAFFSALYLLEGDYFLRVSGTGRGDLVTGYSDYASLGAYTITGTINDGVPADRFSIAEESPVSTVVGTVAPRVSHGAGVIGYQILSGNTGSSFAINALTGEITVASDALLDFETLSTRWDDPPEFELFVEITDDLLTATEIIRTVVSITDINEPPVFPAPDPLVLAEQSIPGTLVTTVKATDPDRADSVAYTIQAGNTAGAFAINPDTGEITVAGTLDFETTPSYTLTLRATDQLSPPNHVDVTLEIDLLDLAENLTPGGVIRTYFENIEGSTISSLTGSAAFPGKPHSEQFLPSFNSGSSARESYGSTVRGYLIAPVTGTYTFLISADEAGELFVSTDDSPANAVLQASLETWANPGDWDKFESQQSGLVSLTAGQKYYIEARHKESDGGDHVQVAWVTPGMAGPEIIPGRWLVPYEEDYAPWAGDTTLTIREAAEDGQRVGALDFIDPDNGGSIISYGITAGNGAGVFQINPITGEISLAGASNITIGETWNLEISATDNGSPALIGSANVTIVARGLNEGLHTWWKIDEFSGISVADSSGNFRNGLLVGAAAWISRDNGNQALQLNGTDSHITYYGGNALSGATSFSVAAWVKVPSEHAANATLIQQQEPGIDGNIGGYVIRATATGNIRFILHGRDAEGVNEGNQFDLTSPNSISDGQWHHVACVRDGNTGRVFIDGVQQASGTGAVRLLNPNLAVAVGKDLRTGNSFLNAIVDDIRIYSDAVSGPQLVGIAGTPKVSILSPVGAYAEIPPDTGIMLTAAASDPDGPAPALAWSKASGPGSVDFGTPAGSVTSALFSSSGTYVLRITASDGAHTDMKEVTVIAGTTASSPFGGVTFGGGPVGSHYVTDIQAYALSGSSDGLTDGGVSDEFYLLGQNFAGNFDVRARVVSVDDVLGTDAERAGLIVRAGTSGAADEAGGFIGFNAGGGLRFISRATPSSANSQTAAEELFAPQWCRIIRVGNTVEFMSSDDAVVWTTRGSLTLSGELRVGLCWSSGNVAESGFALFENVSGFSTSNVGPLVNAGQDAAVVAGIPADLTGSVADDGLPASPGATNPGWTLVGGPDAVAFDNASQAITTATCQANGDHILRLIADDGAVRTFDDVTLSSAIVNTVSVAATDSEASENGPDSGTFTITRGGSLIGDLTVEFSLGGSSVNGDDYALVSTSIIIPHAETTAMITIAPFNDEAIEGPENVTLSINIGDYDIIGGPAQISITDFNLPPAWTGAPFAWPDGLEDAAYSAPSLTTVAADPNTDVLVFTKFSGPGWLEVAGDGSLSGTPNGTDIGSHLFVIRATDPGGLWADAELEIDVNFVNLPPEFTPGTLTPASAIALIAYTGQSLASFASDPNLVQGDVLSFTKIGNGAPWIDVATDGSLSGTAQDLDVGFAFFNVRVTDAAGAFANAQVQIIVMPTVLYLDANGPATGSGAPASITWDASSIWSTSDNGEGHTHGWVDGALAIFSAGNDAAATAITISGSHTVTGIVVEEGEPSLTGGTLELASPLTEFTMITNAAIDTDIIGSGMGLVKTGGGSLTLSGDNSFTGDLLIQSGVLELGPSGKLYNGGPASTPVIRIESSGTWRLVDFSQAGVGQLAEDRERRIIDGGILEITGPTHSSGQNFTVTSNGGTLRYIPENQTLTLVGNATDNLLIEGPLMVDGAGDVDITEVLEGTGSITKAGPGALSLSAVNPLTGSVVVSDGKLVLNGSLDAVSSLSIESGGTLAGSGSVSQAVAVAGQLAPGDGIGTLTTGPLALSTGAYLEWQAGDWSAAPDSGHDLVESAALDLTASASLTIALSEEEISNFTEIPATFVLIRSATPITGFDAENITIDSSGFASATGTWELRVSDNDLVIDYTPLPPWEAWLLANFGPQPRSPLLAGEMADPDHDSSPNLMEYALGTDPNLSEPPGYVLDTINVEGTDYLRITITRNAAATDVTYTLQTTADLTDPGSWSALDTELLVDTPTELVVRDTLGGPSRFIRLRVTR